MQSDLAAAKLFICLAEAFTLLFNLFGRVSTRASLHGTEAVAMVHIAWLVHEREGRQALVGRAVASAHLVRQVFRHDLEAFLY